MGIYRTDQTEQMVFAPASAGPGVTGIAFGRPVITNISPSTLYYSGHPISAVKVEGHNFKLNQTATTVTIAGSDTNLLGVFVSSVPGMFTEQLSSYDYYGSIPALSSYYPSFDAIPVNYNVESDNIITFDLPAPQLDSNDIEVIIANVAGYGTLKPIIDEQPHGDKNILHNKKNTLA